MKILILSLYYSPDLCAGSFRCAALVEQFKQLDESQLEITVLTTMPNRYASFNAEALKFEQQENIRIHRIQLPDHQSGFYDQAKAFLYFAYQAQRKIKGQHYDIIFATSSRLMTGVLGSWFAYHKRAVLYLDIRDIFVMTIDDILPRVLARLTKPLFSKLEKWAFKPAKRINLVSRGFQSYFLERYPQSDLRWFTNGIDPEFLTINVRDSLQPLNTPIRVLYAGNIGEGQGLHMIIPHLANRFKNKIQFQIIGDGGKKKQLELSLIENQCENVEIYSPINRQQLLEFYQQADVLFLHLNDYEVFKKVLPSKIFEYAAMGKPIWAGVTGYCAEFITQEISNSVIFSPCNYLEAEKVFSHLKLEIEDRDYFIKKYLRSNIMREMVLDIVSLAK